MIVSLNVMKIRCRSSHLLALVFLPSLSLLVNRCVDSRAIRGRILILLHGQDAGKKKRTLQRSYHLGVRTYRIREAVVLYIGLEAEDERGLQRQEERRREREDERGKSFLAR